MSQTKAESAANDQRVAQILETMKDVELFGEEAEDDGKNWRELLASLEEDESFAQRNQKRKFLTFQAFKDPAIISKSLALQSLVKPNVHAMHILFKRSEIVGRISREPESAKLESLRQECLASSLNGMHNM